MWTRERDERQEEEPIIVGKHFPPTRIRALQLVGQSWVYVRQKSNRMLELPQCDLFVQN
jgi:hypothetical protein